MTQVLWRKIHECVKQAKNCTCLKTKSETSRLPKTETRMKRFTQIQLKETLYVKEINQNQQNTVKEQKQEMWNKPISRKYGK